MRAVLSAALIFVIAGVIAVLNSKTTETSSTENRDAPVVEPAPPEVSAPPTRLPIELIGTIVRAQGSIATLRLLPRERENVGEGDAIEPVATVLRIERERVTFLNLSSRQEESVRIRPYDPALAVTAQAMSAPGDNKEFNVARAKIDQQLQNISALLMSARAVPVTDPSGRMLGFRIVSLDSSSFFNELGVSAGDLLTEVNGTKLESVEGVVALFNELRDSSLIRLKISRQSRDLQLTYLIR